MKRRKAIVRITLLGISSIAIFGGIKYYYSNKAYSINRIKEHKELISILADLILPQTDTPGAKDANISEVIIDIVQNCYEKDLQQTFINGLFEIENYSKSEYKNQFKDCDINIQNKILKDFEERERINNKLILKVKNKLLGPGFFSMLKHIIVECFFTSEIGATQTLQYDYIPGKYIGCLDIQANQKCWATN